jgi:hypothetical protein
MMRARGIGVGLAETVPRQKRRGVKRPAVPLDRFVKKRIVASQRVRSAEGAINTIHQGNEAMHMIRKRQIRC